MGKKHWRIAAVAAQGLWLIFGAGANCWGQAPTAITSRAAAATVAELDKAPEQTTSNSQGGGSQANFSELMMLIQQSIAPTDWIDGSSVMAPFPAGVVIDPAGQLTHVTPVAEPFPSLLAALALGRQPAWKLPSPLRIVSLRKLDQAVGTVLQRRGRMSQELQQYGQVACEARMQPKTVSGLTACRKLKQGNVVAVVSGGVLLDTKMLSGTDRWQSTAIQVDLPAEPVALSAAPLSSVPLPAAWWWQ